MITVELTMDEAHALSDVMRELVGPQVTPVPIDWEAVRTADKKISNTVTTEEFLLQETKLEAA
jgi:hypothetical protein